MSRRQTGRRQKSCLHIPTLRHPTSSVGLATKVRLLQLLHADIGHFTLSEEDVNTRLLDLFADNFDHSLIYRDSPWPGSHVDSLPPHGL